MSDFGLKVSSQNNDAKGLRNLVVDSKYPQWKCDVRPSPKLYGVLRANVNLEAGETKTILRIPHPYRYVPSFIVAWSYPDGSDKTSSITSSTYGIGNLSITQADFSSTSFTPQINDKEFTIVATTTNAQSNINVEFRFYIFADDFQVGLFGDSL